MAKLPATLTLDGTLVDLEAVTGRDQVGAQFQFEAQITAGDDDVEDLLAKAFVLELRVSDDDDLQISGIVVSVAARYEEGTRRVLLGLGPRQAMLAQGQDSRVYLDKSAKDIVGAVFSRAGLPAPTFTLSGAVTPRPHTVQHQESDWEFCCRLAQEEGWHWFFDHEEESALTFADDSTGATAFGPFLHRVDHGVTATKGWVSSVSLRAQVVSTAFTLRDRDPEKPKLDLLASVEASDKSLALYAWPGRYATATAGKTMAQHELDALRAERTVITGRSGTLKIRAGQRFSVDGDTLPNAARRVFCIAVDYELSARTDNLVYMAFHAVPEGTHYRTRTVDRTRAARGVETAFVGGAAGQEIDVDNKGRVFAEPAWDRDGKKDDASTTRARVGQVPLGRSLGTPRMGWTVLTSHQDGNVDRPVVLHRLIDGTHPVPHKLPDHATRSVWQTLTSPSDDTLSELYFDDKKGAEQVSIRAARDLEVTIGDNEARTVGNRHVLTVDKDRTLAIDADDKLTVTKNQDTSVDGDSAWTVKGSRSVTVKGNETDAVEGARTQASKADLTVDVGKNRKLTVTGKSDAHAKKGLTREVLKKLTLTVAGSGSTKADGGLVITTKGDAEETVGGAFNQEGKEGVQTLVTGDLSQTVGAAHVITAQGSFGDSAKGKLKFTVGAAFSATAAQGIEIVADSEVVITSGGSSITIKAGEVAIKSPMVTVTGPMLVSNGAQVKHNP
jgi:type VI secretion system secreted protein VgrG